MRIVVTGATGNVGSSLLRSLAKDPAVDSIVGVERRLPDMAPPPKTTWAHADVVTDDLVAAFRSADVVVHLAWLIQPARDQRQLWAVNVEGSVRVFEAAAAAGVRSLVYASSIGAYSPGPKEPVDETWPTNGIPTAYYSRQKAYAERALDAVEARNPGLRVVRLRPALIFKETSAAEQRRLFGGPLLPGSLLRPSLIPVLPVTGRLVFQCVHTRDVAEAYRLAVTGDARGAFNIAADPVLDPDRLGKLFGARPVHVPEPVFRWAADLTWRLHLQPTPRDWVDMAFESPLLDTSRARRELGWAPTVSADDTLRELLEGMQEGAGEPTPPLREGARL